MPAAVTVPSGPSNPPNETVYVKNLEEHIKVDQLKEALTEIFSEYGNIVDLVAKQNLKAKGQAFVVFDDVESAEKAIQEVQGFDLFEKPMILDFAKTKSDATVGRVGSEQDLEAHKRKRLAEKERKQATEAADAQKRAKRPAEVNAEAPARPIKATRGSGLKSSNPAAGAVIPEEYLPPNKILFLQNLPDDVDTEFLTRIFGAYEGFREIRLVPGRKGIAFVEYDAETGAISAKEQTAGMQVGDKLMKVVYQRK